MTYETDDPHAEAAAARHDSPSRAPRPVSDEAFIPRTSVERDLFMLAKRKKYFLVDLHDGNFAVERKHSRRFTGRIFEVEAWLHGRPDLP